MSIIDKPVAIAGTATITATLLAVGLGGPTAAADVDESIPTAAVQSVRLDGTNATVTFTDNAEDETGYLIEIRERASMANILTTARVLSVPGVGRVATQVVGGIQEGAEVCADVITLVGEDQSNPSGATCADPAKPPSDLALQNIRGNASPKAGASPAYLIVVDNPGGNDAARVSVSISTSGVATLADQAGVAAGWSANGFTCAPRPPAGGETSALDCTGGNIPKGASVNPAVLVRFTGPGFGTIHAQVNAEGDKNAANNGTAYNLTVG